MKKPTKMDEARQNNSAILNQMTPVEPSSGKKLVDLVFRNKVPDSKFDKVK